MSLTECQDPHVTAVGSPDAAVRHRLVREPSPISNDKHVGDCVSAITGIVEHLVVVLRGHWFILCCEHDQGERAAALDPASRELGDPTLHFCCRHSEQIGNYAHRS